MGNTMIKVNHLSKAFGDLEVLRDINMEVSEGEVVCIIGPSGSGKSTFLRFSGLICFRSRRYSET